MLIHSASQLITMSTGPQRGSRLGELHILTDGAVLLEGETIVEVGQSQDMRRRYPGEPMVDARGHVVMPGFVDAHTHLVWAGSREAEFEQRLQGKSYLEIMRAGGGIQSTVNATRAASSTELLAQTRARAQQIFLHGTTTAEAKSGYGLELESEIKQLSVLVALNNDNWLEVFPTFLGAHAIPPEFHDRPHDYVNLLCSGMLPAVRQWWLEHAAHLALPFVDVFCEKGAFNLAQSRQILQSAKSLDFPLKIHADEFENLGGAALAAEFGAVSADHLVTTSLDDIHTLAQSDTVAVSLPLTPFGLAEKSYSPAREIINAGAIFALASDLNPGTAWCGNMQLVLAIACRYMKLTPAEALAAATINTAAAIGQQQRLGSIHPGKQADLIILSVSDYRHLAYRFGLNLVEKVIKKGKVFSSQTAC